MTNSIITIQNCNNILSGQVIIQENKLNILFGRNGTGKSTIARAMALKSQGKPLKELAPYGIDDENIYPILVEGVVGNIAIFDDDYVSKYVFQPDTLIHDTFEVLIRSDDYDLAKKNIDDALSTIKTTISNREEIKNLQNQIGILIDKIKLTVENKIAKRGGTKSVLEGKGAYFKLPPELKELAPFFDEANPSTYASWRLDGYDKFGKKGCCPYCTITDSEKTKTINNEFVKNFDKTSVEAASAIIKAITALKAYLNEEKQERLISFFGVKENLQELETQLTILLSEANYLNQKLKTIIGFNGSSVDQSNIGDLDNQLLNMKIDFDTCGVFFTSPLLVNELTAVNTEIDNLLIKVNVLKGEIAKYNTYIQTKIADRKKDINEFLALSGFKYHFDVVTDGENNARAFLNFIKPDGNPIGLQSPDKHLSWGEKHSFALILFMFDAISKNANLIILDDPISSFDSNKKYAIINRLFKTGDKTNSLYQRTVLLMSHDFEPVIDYIQVRSGHQSSDSVCASYFENNNGNLVFTSIKKDSDLLSSVVLMKEIASDPNIDIAGRIGCLRKFIEHQYKNPLIESKAYNLLSSLIHGREKPTRDLKGLDPLLDPEVQEATTYIQKFIATFDYSASLKDFKDINLLTRFESESSSYIKILILRAYIEQNEGARDRLRDTNDVVRKYVDETYHIENDYLYSLDFRKFNIVPENYLQVANKFVADEKIFNGVA